MLPATSRGSRSRPARARWSATLLLLTLSVALTGCISVTPAPGTAGPSTPSTASPSPEPTLEPTAEPTPAPTLAPGATATPEPSVTPKPTPPPTPTTAPVETSAGTTAAPSAAPATALASAAPSGVSSSLAPGASPTATPKPEVTPPLLTPGPPRQRALAKTEVYGFLPTWELARADTLDLDLLTTLAFFGLEANARGTLIKTVDGVDTSGWRAWNDPAWIALQARAQEAGVRVVLTIQRFSWSDSQRRRTIRLLQDPAARMRLTSQIMELVTERKMDGVNLDFEPMPAEVSDDFTQFVRELRAAMNAVDPKLQLTFDVMPGIENYDVAPLTDEDAADALFVMGYEYLTGSAAQTGSNAPLVAPSGADLSGDVANILEQVPPGRVILGLPWYGRAWSTTTREPGSETRSGDRWPFSVTINYRDAIVQAAKTGRLYDARQESAWTLYPSKLADCQACRVTWRQLWYDDVDATRAKVDFALGEELRGVGFWALGYQGTGDEMWSVLRLTVGGDRDRKAPEGTATVDPQSTAGERQGLPIVGSRLRLLLTDRDGQGSGPAFVRVSTEADVDADGQLSTGTTFPTTDAITIDPLTAGPVYDLPLPRNQRPRATPTPAPSEVPGSPLPSEEPSVVPGSPAASVPALSPAALSPAPSVVPGSPAPSGSPLPVASGLPSAAPSAAPSASPVPSLTPEPTPTPAGKPGKRTLYVQWRDVAGNWSEPISLDVWYRPGAKPQATPTPAPVESIVPSEPPLVPGEGTDVEDSPEPSVSPA